LIVRCPNATKCCGVECQRDALQGHLTKCIGVSCRKAHDDGLCPKKLTKCRSEKCSHQSPQSEISSHEELCGFVQSEKVLQTIVKDVSNLVQVPDKRQKQEPNVVQVSRETCLNNSNSSKSEVSTRAVSMSDAFLKAKVSKFEQQIEQHQSQCRCVSANAHQF
jgi:hypothetical protein